jgi:hypothetical protein
VRIALQPFAPGGINNPTGAPVFIRFRMTSDVGTSAGENAGWYIDNLVINNLDPASCPTVAPINIGDVVISEVPPARPARPERRIHRVVQQDERARSSLHPTMVPAASLWLRPMRRAR